MQSAVGYLNPCTDSIMLRTMLSIIISKPCTSCEMGAADTCDDFAFCRCWWAAGLSAQPFAATPESGEAGLAVVPLLLGALPWLGALSGLHEVHRSALAWGYRTTEVSENFQP